MPHPTLHVAQPCHESWDAMTPASGGRHCAACQKTVVDFTHKTDAEILAALRQAAGETCGRLRADQLGRPLAARAAARPRRWHAWLGAALLVAGLRRPDQAQAAGRARPPVALAAPTPSGRVATSRLIAEQEPLTESYRLAGLVLDAQTNEPMPGATILLEGTTTGTSTDREGRFTLPLPAKGTILTLIISSVGYETRRQKVNLPAAAKPLIIRLSADTQVLGGLGFVSPPPTLWQRVAQFFA